MPLGDGDRDDSSTRTAWYQMTTRSNGYVPMQSVPDDPTEDPADDDERYRGRRRAASTSRRWQWIAGGLGLLALIVIGAVVARPLRVDDRAQPASTPDAGLSGAANPAQESATPGASPSTSGPAPTAGPTAKPAFSTITVEAEAGTPWITLTGSAHVTTYKGASGGRIVAHIGNWGDGAPGALRINDVMIPSAGRYQIAISYSNSDSPGSHDAVVSWTGARPVTVAFTGGRNCCGVRTVTATLTAGTYSITITNPTNPGPSIDKVVISAA